MNTDTMKYLIVGGAYNGTGVECGVSELYSIMIDNQWHTIG